MPLQAATETHKRIHEPYAPDARAAGGRPPRIVSDKRADGISAMLRVRDGAQFLRIGLDSCIDVFDEIVAVHHQCSDDTPQILHEYAAAYPDRFKVYEYPHEVFPPNTREHAAQGAESPHTIAALCNYALARTTRRFVIKHDADHLYFSRFAKIADFVRSGRADDGVVHVLGVNLARSRAGSLGVYLRYPVCGGGDLMFFPVSRDTYFVHTDRYEVLHLPRCRHVDAGFGFWHLKCLQRHYGLHQWLRRYQTDDSIVKEGYYGLSRDAGPSCGGEKWHGYVAAFERDLEVVSFEEFVALFGGRDSRLLPDVRVLQIPRRATLRHVLEYHWMRPFLGKFVLPFVGARYKFRSQFLFDLLLPYLKARAIARDLRGVSLPAESDLMV